MSEQTYNCPDGCLGCESGDPTEQRCLSNVRPIQGDDSPEPPKDIIGPLRRYSTLPSSPRTGIYEVSVRVLDTTEAGDPEAWKTVRVQGGESPDSDRYDWYGTAAVQYVVTCQIESGEGDTIEVWASANAAIGTIKGRYLGPLPQDGPDYPS